MNLHLKYSTLVCFIVLVMSSCGSKKEIRRTGNDVYNVLSTGLIADDKQEDTKLIQKAILHCKANNIDTLFFPEGTYIVGSVDIFPGQVFLGEEGTIMKKISMAGKWSRMFTTQNNTHLGDKDSEWIVFRDMHFDGNKENQGPYKKYELQQQHMLYFDANPANRGRVRALVEDCSFANSVADGISAWRNADLTVRNCEARNVFRGGVVVTGGHSKVHIENFVAGGDIDVTGIDIEIDAVGYGGKKNAEVTLKNVFLEGDFDVGIPQAGILHADNVQVTGTGFFLNAKNGGKMVIKNSSFVMGTTKQTRIYFPGDVLFENCDFIISRSDIRIAGFTNFMETSYWRKGGQQLKFKGCNFFAKGKGTKKIYGIHNQENFTHLNTNKLVVEDCVFEGGFDAAIFFNKGGQAEINNIYVKDGIGIHMNSVGGRTPMKLSADNIRVGPGVTKIMDHRNPSAKDVIKIGKVYQDDGSRQKSPSSKYISVKKMINLKDAQTRSSDGPKFNKRGTLIKG